MFPGKNSLLFYPHGMLSTCLQCYMSIPHFQCHPILSIGLNRMTDKLEPQVNNPQQTWTTFPTGFARPNDHTFNYEEQNRLREHGPGEFDNELTRQQSASFVQPFLPRIGLPFPDFTDYQRFGGFQRNAFFPNPFAPHLPNPAFPHTFSLNPVHPPMQNMEGFHLSHCPPPPPLAPNTIPPTASKEKPREPPNRIPADHSDKPPVLSAEYPAKQESEMEFDHNHEFPIIPKEEPLDASSARNIANKKPFPFPPTLPPEKPFDHTRVRDEQLIPFQPPFYPPPLNMGISHNNVFKQEMSTPPIHENQPDYRKYDANGKRIDFHPPGALHDCQVCLSTHANGLHFGARTCAACAAFFRRTISDEKSYVCKRNQRCTSASRDGTGYRKICRSCRMKRCLEIGMLPENVQHKRNRRDSGTPPQKTPFGHFFNGFYPTFPNTGPPVQPITLAPTPDSSQTTTTS